MWGGWGRGDGGEGGPGAHPRGAAAAKYHPLCPHAQCWYTMDLTTPGALEGWNTVQSVPFTIERAWEVSTCGWPTMGVQYTASRDCVRAEGRSEASSSSPGRMRRAMAGPGKEGGVRCAN